MYKEDIKVGACLCIKLQLNFMCICMYTRRIDHLNLQRFPYNK